jgi:hypothetical protein
MPSKFPDDYLLICAGHYAATLRKLKDSKNEEEQCRHRRMLHSLMDAGMSEQESEHRRREMRLSQDIRECMEKKISLPPDRVISRQDAELVRQAYSVPPFATIDDLSGQEMLDLADMFEGWAQDGRIDSFGMARLLGWADGFRALVSGIGTDYEPPEQVPGEPDRLMKFLAKEMRKG